MKPAPILRDETCDRCRQQHFEPGGWHEAQCDLGRELAALGVLMSADLQRFRIWRWWTRKVVQESVHPVLAPVLAAHSPWGYIVLIPTIFGALAVAGFTDALPAKIVMAASGVTLVALLWLSFVVEVWRDHKELAAKRRAAE